MACAAAWVPIAKSILQKCRNLTGRALKRMDFNSTAKDVLELLKGEKYGVVARAEQSE